MGEFHGFGANPRCEACKGPPEYKINLQWKGKPLAHVVTCADHALSILKRYVEPFGADKQPLVQWPLGKLDSDTYIELDDALRQLGEAIA